MYSTRIDWRAQPNLISGRLDILRHEAVPILDLTESNPTAAGLLYPEAEILAAFSDSRALRYDPSPQGLPEAREAVAAYYSARSLNVSPDQILLTASTSEAYAFAFKLLADPGDEVAVPRPSYPLFEFLASLESIRPVQYPLIYDRGWFIDFGALESSINSRTRAIVVVNPNNPTGSFLKREEHQRLAALCVKHNLALLSDEVFADYAFDADDSRVCSLTAGAGPLTLVMSGLSKVAVLPQMKLGWMVCSGDRAPAAQAMTRLELIADTYLSVGAPVQYAAARLLSLGEDLQRQVLDRVRRNNRTLRDRPAPFRVLEAEGGWYAILQVPRVRTEEEWVLRLLDRYQVLTQPGFFYDFSSEAYLVVSLLTRPDLFEEGISRIAVCAGE